MGVKSHPWGVRGAWWGAEGLVRLQGARPARLALCSAVKSLTVVALNSSTFKSPLLPPSKVPQGPCYLPQKSPVIPAPLHQKSPKVPPTSFSSPKSFQATLINLLFTLLNFSEPLAM